MTALTATNGDNYFDGYSGGSGNVPAYGTTISQGGVSGVFLGAWANSLPRSPACRQAQPWRI